MTPPMLPVAEIVAVPLVQHAAMTGAAPAPMIFKHDRVLVTVIIGVARIERKVTALQNARAGQMLFVKTDEGDVLAARAERSP